MYEKILFDIADLLHGIFIGRDVIVSGADKVIVKEAAGIMPLIDREINEELIEVGKKYALRTGQIAWTFVDGDLIIDVSPDLTGAAIRSAHWSSVEDDSHSENDADSTYAIINAQGEMLYMFNTKEEAEEFVKRHS